MIALEEARRGMGDKTDQNAFVGMDEISQELKKLSYCRKKKKENQKEKKNIERKSGHCPLIESLYFKSS